MNDEHPDRAFWDNGTSERRRTERLRKQMEARSRRRRFIVAIAAIGVIAFVIAFVSFRLLAGASSKMPAPGSLASKTSASPGTEPGAAKVPATPAAKAAAPSTAGSVSGLHNVASAASKPPIVEDLIPFGPKRRQETIVYSLRHYGQATDVLVPRVIVLHFTDSSTYAPVHALFASDVPNMGVLPGVTSHFVIDKNGTIYQQLPTDLRGRHAVGLNWCAIGIEFVQEQVGGEDAHSADQRILHRKPQLEAGLRLVAWLERVYHISDTNVIGHAMANQSPYFRDLLGWRNDHTDWQAIDVAQFRADLRAMRR
jgi:ribosomal protein L18